MDGENYMKKFEVGDMIVQKVHHTYSHPSKQPAIILEILHGGYRVFFPDGVYNLSTDYAHESYKILSAKSPTGEV